MTVKQTIAAAILAGAIASPTFLPAAQKKSVTRTGEKITATATIVEIDQTARMITFKSPDGTEDTVWAGPEFTRFNELKVGDKVSLTYYTSTVFQLRKPGDPAPPKADTAQVTPGKGAKPSATLAMQTSDTVTVKSVDAAAGTITVTTSKGHVVHRKVENKKNLEGINPGDKIDITYTEAVLATVHPAK